MLVKNSRFEVFNKPGDKIGVICYNSRLAKKLNRHLGYPYPRGTQFEDTEEPQFTVDKNLAYVLMTKILNLDKDYVASKLSRGDDK